MVISKSDEMVFGGGLFKDIGFLDVYFETKTMVGHSKAVQRQL